MKIAVVSPRGYTGLSYYHLSLCESLSFYTIFFNVRRDGNYHGKDMIGVSFER